ncbi:MAG: deoxyguanosinetriphosphate triphosphohydrolase [Verrucomicrobiota bacterium]
MQWHKLLSPARLGKREQAEDNAQRSPFLRDYDRIVFSSAFRRLQDKTQVFPLAESDYVRTRLTHSLEASCVGRSLGTMIGAEIVKKHALAGVHSSDIGAVVAAACLAHDIGNPPFGHSGEDAIRHWFLTSPVARSLHSQLSPGGYADFERFEGNAQGFRILTRLQMPDNQGGLQLTCATLAAFAKYPLESGLREPGDKRASTKKFSYFHSEAPLFDEAAEQTGLISRSRPGSGNSAWCRHPLAFIVEAADDICYRLVDFEDGVRLKLISYEEARDAFAQVIDKPATVARAEKMQGTEERIEFLRAVAIGRTLEQVSNVFLKNEGAILAGEFEQSLIACTEAAEALNKIVRRSQQSLYCSPRGLEIEAAGFEVISGLLDLFVEAVESRAKGGSEMPPRWRNLLQLVPEPFIGPGRVPALDTYTRLQRITDFISGMADSSAVGLYKKLRGISLPGQ